MNLWNMEVNFIAPDIFRKRMLIEGYFEVEVNEDVIREFFSFLTQKLSLLSYGKPIVHATSGFGKHASQGYDAFMPLVDSGVYLAVWSNQKFLSLIIYSCKKLDETEVVFSTVGFFGLKNHEFKVF